ncbi:MAG: Stage sporulation protein [Verrucomicrobiota bacterium]|jgi:cell division protein FtsI (penicillin-binding protein 3)/stage V sporulation protein D (sporulation-specific penicillin-binding protein)
MNAQICSRAGFVCILIALIFSAYSARLIHLQVGRHEELADEAARTTAKKKVITATRGKIVDVRGEVLADNVPVYKVVVDGSILPPKDREALAGILARNLGIAPEKVAERISSDRRYIVVKNGVEASAVENLKEELDATQLRCVLYEHSPKRSYPNESMLAHVLGYLDHEGTGIQGVEKMMEPYLRGEDGFVYTEKDRRGREIVAYRGMERPARDGMTVELTVDMGMQAVVERELDAAYERYNPNMITAVFVRPRTGEILAMATRPTFDPNNYKQAPAEAMKNRAILDKFEPGSTFKLVVIAAALNEHAVSPEQQFFCENGRFRYGGTTLRDDIHSFGSLSVHDILVRSSNIGCAKIALQIGPETLHEYIRRFGFGERTGLGLPGEIAGTVHPVHKWSGLSITRVPMGHEVAVTPLQSAMSMAAIANGGEMMMPQIIRSVRDSSGDEVISLKPTLVRRVVSPEAASEVASALQDVVAEGTGKNAAIPGFKVCGKTGTAQKVDPKGGYASGQLVVSFAGYFPANDPEVAGIVLVDNAKTPGTSNYGGTIAAPVFSAIGRGIAHEMDLVPEAGEPDEATIAALVPRTKNPEKDVN